jgi:hypothetical protein
MPAADSPYGSANMLKVLYKKLQDFADEHNEEYLNVPNAQYSASDILNLLTMKFLLNVTPNDKELQRIAKDMKFIEDAIEETIAELLSSSKGSGSTA